MDARPKSEHTNRKEARNLNQLGLGAYRAKQIDEAVRVDRSLATIRDTTSPGPPGEEGTTNRIGREGNGSCAGAIVAKIAVDKNSANARSSFWAMGMSPLIVMGIVDLISGECND